MDQQSASDLGEILEGMIKDTDRNVVEFGMESVMIGDSMQERRPTMKHRNIDRSKRADGREVCSGRRKDRTIKRAYLMEEQVPSDDSILDPNFNIEDVLNEFSSSGSETENGSGCSHIKSIALGSNRQLVTQNVECSDVGMFGLEGQTMQIDVQGGNSEAADDVKGDTSQLENNNDINVTPQITLFQRRAVMSGRKSVYDKTNYCTSCGTGIKNKICRHMLTVHKNEKQIMDILLQAKRCAERMKLLKLLCKHNAKVLKQGEGQIVIGRRTSGTSGVNRPATQYLPCEFCKRFIVKENLWRHYKSCKSRLEYYAGNQMSCPTHTDENVRDVKNRTMAIQGSRMLLHSVLFTDSEEILMELMERMRDDDVKETVIKDKLIRKYACLRM